MCEKAKVKKCFSFKSAVFPYFPIRVRSLAERIYAIGKSSNFERGGGGRDYGSGVRFLNSCQVFGVQAQNAATAANTVYVFEFLA